MENEKELSVLNEEQLSIVLKKTPKEVVKTRPGPKGMKLNYVDGAYVIRVLNNAFGYNWDFNVVDQKDYDYEILRLDKSQNKYLPRPVKEIVIKGRLEVRNKEGMSIIKEQYGSKVWEGGGTPIGDAVKSASTDALKKCASLIGVALDLYEHDNDYNDIIENAESDYKMEQVKVETIRETLIKSCIVIASEKGYSKEKLNELIKKRYTEVHEKNPNFLLYERLDLLPDSHIVRLEGYLQTIPAIQEQLKEKELTTQLKTEPETIPENVQLFPEKKTEKVDKRKWTKKDYIHEVSRLRLEKNLVIDYDTYKFGAQTLDDLTMNDLKMIVNQIKENEIQADNTIINAEKENIKAGVKNIEVELRKQIKSLLEQCECELHEIAGVDTVESLFIEDLQKIKRNLTGLVKTQEKEKEDLQPYYIEIVKLAKEKNIDIGEFCNEFFKKEINPDKLTSKQLITIIEELKKE